MPIRDCIHHGMGVSINDIGYRMSLGLGEWFYTPPASDAFEYRAEFRSCEYQSDDRDFDYRTPYRYFVFTVGTRR